MVAKATFGRCQGKSGSAAVTLDITLNIRYSFITEKLKKVFQEISGKASKLYFKRTHDVQKNHS